MTLAKLTRYEIGRAVQYTGTINGWSISVRQRDPIDNEGTFIYDLTMGLDHRMIEIKGFELDPILDAIEQYAV